MSRITSNGSGICAAHLLALMLGLVVGGAACLTGGGPALPDLSTEHNQITQRTERLRRIEELMERDVERFEVLREQFFETGEELYARPFPLDLYKHVAMECLNEPWDANELEEELPQAEAMEALMCRPEFVDRLVVELHRQAPERRQEAVSKLHTLDEVRQLRGRLRRRLSRIEPILRASKNMVAARRADLRQMRLSYERRRTEYSAERWSQLQDGFEEYGEYLDDLERKIGSLERLWPSWPETLDRSVSMLYMDLSKLSH
ncbi:MAG: hypothetical protein ACOC9J_04925 [Persicimonas sp.]